MPNDNDAVSTARAAAAQKKKAPRKRDKKPKEDIAAVKSGKVITTGRASNAPAERFAYVLGDQHKAVHDYLRCIFKPSKYQARVPQSRGGFELYTELWDTKESGTAVAGLTGTGFIGLCAPNWLESGNYDGVPDTGTQCLGYTTMGAACIRSADATATYSGFPLLGATLGSNFYSSDDLDRPTDSALTASSRIRLVAMELRIHSVMSALTSKGEIMLVGSVNPAGGSQGGAINTATWDDLVKTPDAVVTRAIRSLQNWGSDEVFSIVAIPGEEQCFEMVQVPATAYTYNNIGNRLCPWFHLGAIFRSMTPGDTVNYEITYVWETELAKTNRSTATGAKVVPVPSSTLNLAASNARPFATSTLPGIHAVPFVQTMATTEPAVLSALSRHPSLPAELREQIANRPALRPVSESGFMSKISGLAKDALTAAADSSWLKKVPYVGGIVSGLSGMLSNLFD